MPTRVRSVVAYDVEQDEATIEYKGARLCVDTALLSHGGDTGLRHVQHEATSAGAGASARSAAQASAAGLAPGGDDASPSPRPSAGKQVAFLELRRLVQFIGEMIRADSPHRDAYEGHATAGMKLRARVARVVDGMDTELFEQALVRASSHPKPYYSSVLRTLALSLSLSLSLCPRSYIYVPSLVNTCPACDRSQAARRKFEVDFVHPIDPE